MDSFMLLNINDISEKGLTKSIDVTISEQDINGNVSAKLTIFKAADIVIVEGKLYGKIEMPCSRCLELYPLEIDAEIEAKYISIERAIKDKDYELNKDELDVAYYSEGMIDLSEIVKEHLFLNIPIKPLCDEFCKGFCSVCYTNLNENTCNCKIEHVDPRFAVLKKLLKGAENG